LLVDEPDRLTSLIRLLFLRRFRCSSISHTDNRLSRRLIPAKSGVAIGDDTAGLG
jgi:hypothetical protein